ncbi:MAG: hypothetical protein AD742_18555 [Methylibium sp. NZG]|nr:MAG: hypothetical protein AD742_18555 [Methylibium sp. NZG]
MFSTTMTSQGLAPARPPAVGEALRELSSATQRLGAAVWATLPQRRSAPAQALSRAEEAARVRELAGSYQRTDPGFAADLYAAVDRYERAHEL